MVGHCRPKLYTITFIAAISAGGLNTITFSATTSAGEEAHAVAYKAAINTYGVEDSWNSN